MDRIIPGPEMTAAVERVYPKISENGGRPPIPLERMLRIYFLQAVVQLLGPGGRGSVVRRHVAVVQGRDTEKSMTHGKHSSGKYVWMDVFVKRDGKWRAVRSESTMVK